MLRTAQSSCDTMQIYWGLYCINNDHAYDSKDDNGKHDEEADLHERGQSLDDGLQHNL